MIDPVTLRLSRHFSGQGVETSLDTARTSACATVLVTGAGGFIGSALVKAIAAAGPERIVLLDASEHNLFGIHRYLEEVHPSVAHEAILGSVTDARLIHGVFGRFRPRIVYHAAALKHVPLLELNPFAAVRNNAIGTHTLAGAALAYNVPALVLVSTDKAVNPHSIMGASKRLAELTVTALSGPACRMNAVRLGNVVGSTGSVVPIFLEQIARGGPVTVTHPEVSRYFMSLQEAVEAILAGGAADCDGKILLPVLGEPENIADRARFLIETAGRRRRTAPPHIEIRFIGLRPGEKLHEDLMFQTEIRDGSAGPLAVIRTPTPAPAELHGRMAQIDCLLAGGDLAALLETICAMVPEYQPSSVVRSAAE
ncbi:MAG: polysaccharide biosynthesis protein [Bryobacteraceae bacterium]|jgi:FlaA1/EpsC-like NDP-sugar epimerase